MTESDWLACERPQEMLAWAAVPSGGTRLPSGEMRRDYVQRGVSCRKLRLFAVACCREVWHRLTDERSRKAVEVGEAYADGERASEVRAAIDEAGEAHLEATRGTIADEAVAWAALCCVLSDDSLPSFRLLPEGILPYARQANLLRDIIGNPWRPITFDTAWRTPTVLSLAQAAYEERPAEQGHLDPVRLAILADALEEAGAADEAVLRHLRGEQKCVRCGGVGVHPAYEFNPPLPLPVKVKERCPDCCGLGWDRLTGGHTRGCWAVDIVLQRS